MGVLVCKICGQIDGFGTPFEDGYYCDKHRPTYTNDRVGQTFIITKK